MLPFRKDPADIARAMTGRVADRHAVLGSPRVENHAAFLARSSQGQLSCVWFGGSLEGKADICIFRSRLAGDTWSEPTATSVPNNNSSIAAIRLTDGRVALYCNPMNADMPPDKRVSLYDELGEDDRSEATGGCTPIWGAPRAPLVVALSADDGQTFPRSIIVAESTGTCLSNNSEDGRNQELSYPALLESPDSGLDVAFTLHRRAIAYRHLTPCDIAEAK